MCPSAFPTKSLAGNLMFGGLVGNIAASWGWKRSKNENEANACRLLCFSQVLDKNGLWEKMRCENLEKKQRMCAREKGERIYDLREACVYKPLPCLSRSLLLYTIVTKIILSTKNNIISDNVGFSFPPNLSQKSPCLICWLSNPVRFLTYWIVRIEQNIRHLCVVLSSIKHARGTLHAKSACENAEIRQ